MTSLDNTLSREVAMTGQKAREWTARRNAAICQAHAVGGSLRQIGALVGLTHVAVKQIVDRDA